MSELTDLEIERAIADIEGVHYIETKYDKNNFLALVDGNYSCGSPMEMIGKYSPLTDDALIKQLIFKHEVTIIWGRKCVMMYKNPNVKPIDTVTLFFKGIFELNRIICLAIIEAHEG
jgi:hypothetical protein